MSKIANAFENGTALLFDYSRRDPLNHNAQVKEVKIHGDV